MGEESSGSAEVGLCSFFGWEVAVVADRVRVAGTEGGL